MATVYDLDQLTGPRAWGEPPFRAKQVHRQLWRRAAVRPDARRPQAPARTPRAELPIGVEVLEEREADGRDPKALLRIGGRHVIETVLMGYRDRVTVCVSTQTGCAMGCGFCATGQMGLRNNLTAGEIAAQAVWARREAAALPASTPRRLSNAVFMGMGEPLSNERHARSALACSRTRWGWGPARHGLDRRRRARDPPPRRGVPAGRARGQPPRPTTACATGSCPSTSSGRSRS